MNQTDRKRLYRAGKIYGAGEILLILILVAIWNGGEWESTPTWIYPIAIFIGGVSIWYGAKTKNDLINLGNPQ